jgi:hypothetical protein
MYHVTDCKPTAKQKAGSDSSDRESDYMAEKPSKKARAQVADGDTAIDIDATDTDNEKYHGRDMAAMVARKNKSMVKKSTLTADLDGVFGKVEERVVDGVKVPSVPCLVCL